MFRSIRCLHRHRADGGLVGASAHVVANHLDLRRRPGGAKPQRLFPKGTPNVIIAIWRIGVHCIFQRIRGSGSMDGEAPWRHSSSLYFRITCLLGGAIALVLVIQIKTGPTCAITCRACKFGGCFSCWRGAAWPCSVRPPADARAEPVGPLLLRGTGDCSTASGSAH